MPPADDPLARLHGREAFWGFLERHPPEDQAHPLTSAALLLGPTELDLYMLFEAVRGLGGYETVLSRRQFGMLNDYLLLPQTVNKHGTPLKNRYARYCTPYEAQLVEAVDAAYRAISLSDPSFKFLQARGVPLHGGGEPNASTALPRRRSLRASQRCAAGTSEYDPERKDLPEASLAAKRARMPCFKLQDLELNHRLFRRFRTRLIQLDLRNHILRMWYQSLTTRLTINTAMANVPPRYHALGVAVFTFLEAHGMINFGAIPLETPFAGFIQSQLGASPSIAVVGAGMAGLTAARHLLSFGFRVKLIEARRRPGGRIHTDQRELGAPVDCGAMVLTGTLQNPLAILAQQVGATTHVVDVACPIFDADGSLVEKTADEPAEKFFNEVMDATEALRRSLGPGSGCETMSLGQAFRQELTRVAPAEAEGVFESKPNLAARRSHPFAPSGALVPGSATATAAAFTGHGVGVAVPEQAENSPAPPQVLRLKRRRSSAEHGPRKRTVGGQGATSAPLTAASRAEVVLGTTLPIAPGARMPYDFGLRCRLLRWHCANLEYGCAADMGSISLLHWDQDDPFEFEGSHALLGDGFGSLVLGLLTDMQYEVSYNSIVRKITSDSSRREKSILLEFESGGYLYDEKFDAVIVTVPLGVLKEGAIAFDPPLPREKLEPIGRLGNGGLLKVMLEFKKKFWGRDDMFGLLRESWEQRGEFFMCWSLRKSTGKNILAILVTEPSVLRVETMTNEEIVERAMRVLRKPFPAAADPVSHIVTRWSSDPFARGAYSFMPMGSSGEDYDRLAEQVGNSIFFAGEHTVRNYPTTAASALISGYREATKVLEQYDVVSILERYHRRELRRLNFKPTSRMAPTTPSRIDDGMQEVGDDGETQDEDDDDDDDDNDGHDVEIVNSAAAHGGSPLANISGGAGPTEQVDDGTKEAETGDAAEERVNGAADGVQAGSINRVEDGSSVVEKNNDAKAKGSDVVGVVGKGGQSDLGEGKGTGNSAGGGTSTRVDDDSPGASSGDAEKSTTVRRQARRRTVTPRRNTQGNNSRKRLKPNASEN